MLTLGEIQWNHVMSFSAVKTKNVLFSKELDQKNAGRFQELRAPLLDFLTWTPNTSLKTETSAHIVSILNIIKMK